MVMGHEKSCGSPPPAAVNGGKARVMATVAETVKIFVTEARTEADDFDWRHQRAASDRMRQTTAMLR